MNTQSKNKKRRRGLQPFRNPQSASRIGTFRNPQSASRNRTVGRPSVKPRPFLALDSRLSTLDPHGLTLIELMVVIVILMTLVGGVIPVLSPNNEARKIRDASRGLQTYIMQAQARAARSGRPAGIAFRETSPGSGVALEVFQIEIPPPFTGFSSSASAIFYLNPGGKSYSIQLGEGFGDSFVNGGKNVFYVPPLFTKDGDLMKVGNALFRLERTGKRYKDWEDVDGVVYFLGVNRYKLAILISGSAPPTFALDYSFQAGNTTRHTTHPNSFRIFRQPVNTSESPYTLPAGVAIDMHASGTEGGAKPTLFAKAKYRQRTTTIKQIGIMFSPSGGIDSIHYNGAVFGPTSVAPFRESVLSPITDASRVFLLLGRVENVLDEKVMNPNQSQSLFSIDRTASDEQLAELQQRINWLNLDSRWIVFDARSGRSVVTENTFVDARNLDLWAQLDAARQFARQMRSGSGR